MIIKALQHEVVGPLVLGLALLMAYSNIYSNQYLLDDEFLLEKNRYIKDLDYFDRIFTSSSTMGAGGTDSFYRPMQTLAYFVTYQIFGMSKAAFHALNLFFHFLNALLIYLLARRRLSLSMGFAVLPALLWGLHPLHTEAVTYMSATADPLHTLFVLLAVFFLERRGLAAFFFFLGLLSKESAIVFPALACVWIGVKSSAPFRLSTYRPTWPFWLMALAYLIARKTFLNFDDTFSFYKEANIYTENIHYRLFTFLATLPDYLGLLFWPHDLHMERNFPVFASFWLWPPMVGFLLLLLGFIFSWRERGRDFRPVSLMFFWFMAAHVPHTGVLLPVNSLFLEHWMYLPSVGLVLGAGSLLARKISYRWVWAVAIPCALALGYKTYTQNAVWQDPITFYEHILSLDRGNSRVQNNLAMAYGESGQTERAIEHYLKAIEFEDRYPQVRHNLAEEYMKLGNLEQALIHLHRAIEINPRFYHSYKDLAAVYQRLGDQKKAMEYYNQYQKLRPE
ncbi:MAG: tetratricopeptide repeat protein [Bdellovibrionales bacterium]